MSAVILLAKLFAYAANVSRDPHYAASHPHEAAEARAAAVELRANHPHIASLLFTNPAHIKEIGYLVSESQVVANMGPGVRDMYNKLLRDDPKQARAFLIQEMMKNLTLMGDLLSNVSKTRSEISMSFARNARG